MEMGKTTDHLKSFLGMVTPITSLDEDRRFKFKLIARDGRTFYLAADRIHQLAFKMDVWEEFEIRGVPLAGDVLVVKTANLVEEE